jgi:branched-chain amino acid transport system permease protein
MVTMVVIGGLGSMPGGLIGSLVVILLPEYLRFLADYRLVVYGSLLITFMIFLPGGLTDLARKPAGWIARGIKGQSEFGGVKRDSAQN